MQRPPNGHLPPFCVSQTVIHLYFLYSKLICLSSQVFWGSLICRDFGSWTPYDGISRSATNARSEVFDLKTDEVRIGRRISAQPRAPSPTPASRGLPFPLAGEGRPTVGRRSQREAAPRLFPSLLGGEALAVRGRVGDGAEASLPEGKLTHFFRTLPAFRRLVCGPG